MNDTDLIGLTADIVSAHVSHNSVPTAEVPALIRAVYEALDRTGQPEVKAQPALEPAVSIRASIKPDYLICLEDGKKLKMLKRYLRTNYNMTPDEYRAKWGLPKDYPMVAPSYREARSALAHQIGLGRKKVAPAASKASPATSKAAPAAPKTAKPVKAAPAAAKAPKVAPAAPKAAPKAPKAPKAASAALKVAPKTAKPVKAAKPKATKPAVTAPAPAAKTAKAAKPSAAKAPARKPDTRTTKAAVKANGAARTKVLNA